MSRSLRFSSRLFWLIALLWLAVPNRSFAQEPSKRLILKDGSYQLVTQYEVKGDRVRYMSAERNEWEELPSALVDWPATEKYEKEKATSAIPEAVAIDKETDAELEADEPHLPEVAPGLRLPDDSGVFMLDNYQGQPQVVELQQTESNLNQGSRASILRGALIPMAGAKQTIELDGAHAAIHSHVAVPSIYINVQNETPGPPPGETASAKMSQPSLDAPRAEQPQQPEQAIVPFDRFRIVRAKVKNGKRIVGDVKRNVAGKVSENETFVKTTIDRIKGGWLKVTPIADLAPGEYVLVETQGNEGMNLYVWDFGVDPKAPANANPWKPETKSAVKPATKPGDNSK
ncbi:MAG: hypothetical protein WA252_00910 [Candidatus Sulfotelmatobacter sp.]